MRLGYNRALLLDVRAIFRRAGVFVRPPGVRKKTRLELVAANATKFYDRGILRNPRKLLLEFLPTFPESILSDLENGDALFDMLVLRHQAFQSFQYPRLLEATESRAKLLRLINRGRILSERLCHDTVMALDDAVPARLRTQGAKILNPSSTTVIEYSS